MNAQEIINQFKIDVEQYNGVIVHHGAVVGVLKKAIRNDSDYRLVLKALTGKTSSKSLSPAEMYALHQFVLPVKPVGGKWQSRRGDEELKKMCNVLINSTVEQEGKTSFLETVQEALAEINDSSTNEKFNPLMTKSEFEKAYLKDDDEYEPPF